MQSLLAGALPIAIGAVALRAQAAESGRLLLLIVCVALCARFFGAVPALVCIAVSTLALAMFAQPAAGVQLIRLGTFVAAALVVAAASDRRSIGVRAMRTERLYALFDGVVEGIFFFDSTGRCIEVNPAAATLIGVDRKTLVGVRIGSLTPSPDETITNAFLAELEKERQLRGHFVVQRADGAFREIEYGAVTEVLPGVHCLIAHDVTERNETERSFRQLSRRLLDLQEEERRRIARELHDTTGQHLAALRLNLSRILRTPHPPPELLDETFALIDRSASEIRTLSYLLHPPMIEEAGLVATLRWYVRGFEERSGIAVHLEVDDDLGRVTADAATSLFRVIQEALTNIHRHSGSTEATVRATRQGGTLRLEIADEGRGLPSELIDHIDELGAFGVGLAGMKERIESLGGTLRIESGIGGTRLIATLPSAGSENQTSSDGEFGTGRASGG